VLVLCVGPATRLADYVQAQPKRYRAQVALGATSTTDDPEGRIVETAGPVIPDEPAIRQVLGDFIGASQQVPPAHSAVHVGGRRAYKLARAGRAAALPPRRVVIHSIELLDYAYPHLEIDVACGSGTYIRALARDIGRRLGAGGYCSGLTRTKVGDFSIEDAVAPDVLDPSRHLLRPVFALRGMPQIVVNDAGARRISMGKTVRIETHGFQSVGAGSRGDGAATEIAVLDERGELLAIGVILGDKRVLKPSKVFASK